MVRGALVVVVPVLLGVFVFVLLQFAGCMDAEPGERPAAVSSAQTDPVRDRGVFAWLYELRVRPTGNPDVLQALARLGREGDDRLAEAAIDALGRAARAHRLSGAHELLVDLALAAPQEVRRLQALQALDVDALTTVEVDRFVTLARSPSLDVRAAAVEALVRSGSAHRLTELRDLEPCPWIQERMDAALGTSATPGATGLSWIGASP
jgi:HEAT repeat protein